ncbi:MAG: hypothetical protein U1F83_11515 [Verrucomicrobiota bacterium]
MTQLSLSPRQRSSPKQRGPAPKLSTVQKRMIHVASRSNRRDDFIQSMLNPGPEQRESPWPENASVSCEEQRDQKSCLLPLEGEAMPFPCETT